MIRDLGLVSGDVQKHVRKIGVEYIVCSRVTVMEINMISGIDSEPLFHQQLLGLTGSQPEGTVLFGEP